MDFINFSLRFVYLNVPYLGIEVTHKIHTVNFNYSVSISWSFQLSLREMSYFKTQKTLIVFPVSVSHNIYKRYKVCHTFSKLGDSNPTRALFPTPQRSSSGTKRKGYEKAALSLTNLYHLSKSLVKRCFYITVESLYKKYPSQ